MGGNCFLRLAAISENQPQTAGPSGGFFIVLRRGNRVISRDKAHHFLSASGHEMAVIMSGTITKQ
jgi:hypothetical protein